ncbi:MAG: AAA family ATPase [Nitrososphaerales archaeon]
MTQIKTSFLRKATRQKAKIRLGLSAVAGGGKTFSALLIAKGLANGDLSKVAVIDTENSSADLYSHLGNYNVLTMQAPFSPESFISAIKECEDAGMQVIIIDSITHEWEGKGGCLEIHSSMTGNSYTNWSSVTPRHAAFVNAILQSKCHVITTVRRKQDYEMNKNDQGKTTVAKVGLKEITREGFEYELTVNLELDIKHNATSSKDRTGLFMGQAPFIPSEETGKKILEWCEIGTDIIKQPSIKDKVISKMNLAADLKELSGIYGSLADDLKRDSEIIKLKDELKIKFTNKTTTPIQA